MGETDLIDCTECAGPNPPAGTIGHGMVLVDSEPVMLSADGNHPPQDTVRPCSRCRPDTFRRWRRGHWPCPKRGGPCSECKRLMGVAAPDEEEMLPAQDTRYEHEPEPPPPGYEQEEFGGV